MRASDSTRARERAAHTSWSDNDSGGAGGRIRTCVAVRRRIYSPLELATLPPLRESLLRSPSRRLGWLAGRCGAAPHPAVWVEPERGFEPANLPITNRLRCHCATRAGARPDAREKQTIPRPP